MQKKLPLAVMLLMIAQSPVIAADDWYVFGFTSDSPKQGYATVNAYSNGTVITIKITKAKNKSLQLLQPHGNDPGKVLKDWTVENGTIVSYRIDTPGKLLIVCGGAYDNQVAEKCAGDSHKKEENYLRFKDGTRYTVVIKPATPQNPNP